MAKVGYTEERPGVKSSIRLVFLSGMIWAMIFTSVGAFVFKWSYGEIIAVFTGISAPFIGIKIGQKPMETRAAKKNEGEDNPGETT